MEYKRAFCFGDSYTYYEWPTWADILEKDLDIPVQNWGLKGLGNVGILSRMVECDIINTFTDKDLIIVLWSTWSREDRYIEGEWTPYGNILNPQPQQRSIYDSNFIKRYWDPCNDVIKNSTAIISANKMFNIFDNFSFIPMNNFDELKVGDPQTEQEINENNLIKFYLKNFPNIKYFGDYESKIKNLTDDPHPDIIIYNNFVKDEIYSKLGIVMKPTTEKDVQSYQDAFLHELVKKADSKNKVDFRTGKVAYIASQLWRSNNWIRNTNSKKK